VATRDGMVLARYVNSGVHVNAGQACCASRYKPMSIDLELPDRLISRYTPARK